MGWLTVLKFGPYVVIALLLASTYWFNHNWQREMVKNGELNQQISTLAQFNKGLTQEVKDANDKIKKTAGAGAVSYGQCQDIIKNNATISFDKGVSFGRATCSPPTH